VEAAAAIGALTVGITGGDGGKLARSVNLSLVVETHRTCRIQEAHLFIGHSLCEMIETAVAESDDVRSS
ncbi:MAG: phosphoheptose isomerase, partial [Acidimicrobiia bacterium]